MTTQNFLSRADFASLRYSAGGHPLTRQVSQRIGALLAWLAYRAKLTPSTVTLLGLGMFIFVAFLYATLPADFESMLLCLVLLQIGYALDCADGQLARATRATGAFGAWLDVACDYVRVIALSAAALYWLATRGMGLAGAATSSALFAAGVAVHIHTATALRGDAAGPGLEAQGARQRIRWAITLLCDTVTVLLLFALLRANPAVLAPYLAAMGLLYMAVSAYLTRQRLR